MTSGRRIKGTTRVRTMVAADDPRFSHIHPDALGRIGYGAKYVSSGRTSYSIRQDTGGYWYIVPYGGTPQKALRGRYTSFQECERDLIKYLKSKDKFGDRAFYPGSKAQEKYGKSPS